MRTPSQIFSLKTTTSLWQYLQNLAAWFKLKLDSTNRQSPKAAHLTLEAPRWTTNKPQRLITPRLSYERPSRIFSENDFSPLIHLFFSRKFYLFDACLNSIKLLSTLNLTFGWSTFTSSCLHNQNSREFCYLLGIVLTCSFQVSAKSHSRTLKPACRNVHISFMGSLELMMPRRSFLWTLIRIWIKEKVWNYFLHHRLNI